MTLARQRPDELSAAFEAHRRELRVHCYRMTGSFTDAEDLTQDVFTRAWASLDRFDGRASMRTWLYRIATNACLDFLKSHQRRTQPAASIADTLELESWIDPYPDELDPADHVAQREITDLYLVAALTHLPPRQRAVLIARDLLDLDAATTATLIGCSAVAVNSLLQRAHSRLRQLEMTDIAPRSEDDEPVVRAYIDAHNRGDIDAIVSLLADDVRISMPPEQPCHGVRDATQFFVDLLGPSGPGEWRLVRLRANGRPAVANYLRQARGSAFQATSIDVLHIVEGRIAAVHCFLGGSRFGAFGLAPVPVDTTRIHAVKEP